MSTATNNTSSWLLAVLALLPAIVLMIYIYKKDRAEKEPIGLLIGLFFMGVLSVIPSIFAEQFAGGVLETAVDNMISKTGSISMVGYHVYQFINTFICVALIEEGFKWLFCYLITHNNKNFNSLFDGMVYTVFVSLGFAAAENVMYVFNYGLTNALMRMVTAVPAHCFFAVIMGYYYSMWMVSHKASLLESRLRSAGVIPRGPSAFKPGKFLVLSILIPVLAHGFYDFCALMGLWIYTVIFYAFLILLYILCFARVRKMSKMDTHNSFLSMAIVLKVYPQAAAYISTIPEFSVYFRPAQYAPQQRY